MEPASWSDSWVQDTSGRFWCVYEPETFVYGPNYSVETQAGDVVKALTKKCDGPDVTHAIVPLDFHSVPMWPVESSKNPLLYIFHWCANPTCGNEIQDIGRLALHLVLSKTEDSSYSITWLVRLLCLDCSPDGGTTWFPIALEARPLLVNVMISLLSSFDYTPSRRQCRVCQVLLDIAGGLVCDHEICQKVVEMAEPETSFEYAVAMLEHFKDHKFNPNKFLRWPLCDSDPFCGKDADPSLSCLVCKRVSWCSAACRKANIDAHLEACKPWMDQWSLERIFFHTNEK